jgi:Zn finger protein HypA/HybF involved in hydrogenase expression
MNLEDFLRENNISKEDLKKLLIEPEKPAEKSENKFECLACDNKFSSAAKKRVCPNCKSKNIIPVIEAEPEKNPNESFIHNPSPQPQRKGPDGQNYTKSEQIHVKTGNRFADQGEFKEDKSYLPERLAPRRPGYKPKKVTCTICDGTFEVNPMFLKDRSVWKCNKCLSKQK